MSNADWLLLLPQIVAFHATAIEMPLPLPPDSLFFLLYFFFQPTRLICKTVTVAGATAAREDYAN